MSSHLPGPEAAGAAALTICEILLAQFVVGGVMPGKQAEALLAAARVAHEDSDHELRKHEVVGAVEHVRRQLKPLLEAG